MDLTKQQLNILRDLTDLRSSVENTLELMEARTNIFLHTLPRLGGLSATPGWFKMQIYDILDTDNELSSLSVQVAKRLAALLERERPSGWKLVNSGSISTGKALYIALLQITQGLVSTTITYSLKSRIKMITLSLHIL